MSVGIYSGDDGMVRQSINMTVEQLQIESSMVTELQEPGQLLKAKSGDIVELSFEDIYAYLKNSNTIELTKKNRPKIGTKAAGKRKTGGV